MKFTPLEIPEVILIEPDVFRDSRGFFMETYQALKYRDGGVPGPFVQDNHSSSLRNVLRGLHAQRLHPQGKLIRVIEGEIFDVAVDIRRGSQHFGKWVAANLSAENCCQLYIPAGFAHGFCVLSARAQVEYKCTEFYHPGDELTVLWNDPEMAIPWPVTDPILSDKDASAKRLRELGEVLPL